MERRLKSLRRKFLSVFLSICLSWGFVPSMAAAQGGTTVYISPAVTGVPAGGEFFVNLKIDDVTDLRAWSVTVAVTDTSVVKIKSFTEGEFLKRNGGTTLPIGGTPSADGSTVDYATALIGTNPAHSVSAPPTGTLATITFSVVGTGTSAINITSYELLVGLALTPISATTTDGAFDNQAPAAVTNLATSEPTNNSIKLTWTAPGDDGATGTASSYDIRYATSAIDTEAKFDAATPAVGEPAPQVAGAAETFVVTGLNPSTTYYFALKTSDEVPNVSGISNSPSETTSALPDTTAPAAVTNLATSEPTNNSIKLTWTAPGDDGATGTAYQYDIRYASSIIDTEAKFDAATAVTSEPTPQVAGSAETFVVTGLSPLTTYYFALKTSDEVPNVSGLSNSPSGTTLAPPTDTTAPAAVTNLATSDPTRNSIKLTWTAPGNDGTTGTAYQYDIRYASSIIDTDAKFDSATQASGEPTPQVAGSAETFVVTGLSPLTTYYFALKTRDEVPNWSTLSNSPAGTTTADNPPSVSISSPADGSKVGGTIPVTVEATDDAGVIKVEFYVNSELKSTDTDGPYAWSWDTTQYTDGPYPLKAKAYDTAGQMAEDVHSITVDNTKPTSTITKPADGIYLYQTTYKIEGTAANSTSGVAKVEVSIDSGEWKQATGTANWSYQWAVPTEERSYTIQSRAVDNAGNVQDPVYGITVHVRRHYAETVNSAGKTITTNYGDKIEIPANALTESQPITVDVIASSALPDISGYTALPRAFDFGPDGLIFAKDVTITIHYTDEEVAGLDESKLGVYYHDGSKWVFVENPVRDTTANTLTIKINHFTYFAVFVIPAPTVASIMPNSGVNTGSMNITDLAGTNFRSGATVKLGKSGETDITATNVVVVSPTKITCTLDLTGKTTGKWNVVVTNPDGQSGTLGEGFNITAPPADTTAPAIPTGLTATAGNQEIALLWTANTETDLQGYKIYYGTASGSYGTPITVGKVTSYRLTGLTNDTIYYIAISSYDTASPPNESVKSTQVSATPTALAVSGYYSLTVTLSVDKATSPPGNVLNYTITYQNTGIGTLTNVVLTNTIPQGTTYVADSATGGGVYDQTAKALTWTLPSLSPSSSSTVTFKVTMDAGATGTIVDTVTARSSETPDPKTASVSTTISVVLGETGQPPAAGAEAAAAALPQKLPKTGFNLLWYLIASLMAITLGFGLQYIDRFALPQKSRIRKRKAKG